MGKLLENDDYKEIYHKYLKQISDNYFSSGTFNNRVTQINKLISNYVKKMLRHFIIMKNIKLE
ncbi:CotH kinase family protein [Paraclostridium bifermentans]|nr:CotH kinase family protein [Paraclostridium bifermentans]